MRKNILLPALVSFCCLAALAAQQAKAAAQDWDTDTTALADRVDPDHKGWYGILTYSPSLPVGKTKDFTGDFSFTGGGIEGLTLIKPNIALGISARFHYLYEKRENALYTGDKNDFSIYGTQYRSSYIVPLQVKGTYLFSPMHHLNPFVALGVGSTYQDGQLQLGTYVLTKAGWEFSLAPEVGVLYRNSPALSTLFSVRYDQGFGTDSLPSVQFISFNLGIVGKF